MRLLNKIKRLLIFSLIMVLTMTNITSAFASGFSGENGGGGNIVPDGSTVN